MNRYDSELHTSGTTQVRVSRDADYQVRIKLPFIETRTVFVHAGGVLVYQVPRALKLSCSSAIKFSCFAA